MSITIFILVLFKVEVFAHICIKFYFVLTAYCFELFLIRRFFSNPLQCLVMLLLVLFSLLLSSLYPFYTSHPTPPHMCLSVTSLLSGANLPFTHQELHLLSLSLTLEGVCLGIDGRTVMNNISIKHSELFKT